ncbi:MAG: ComEC/Rec2 family competence protein, partial [Bifidobacteriaceae bacterium]|nr:ComEC/Rec2 family competence protein [Bifidobacteriaceae bacterium]
LAAGLGAATLVAFAGLIGPGPSVLRAVLMGGAAVLGLASGKARLALGALAGAAALALVANPWLARSYGLILSALATGALIVIAPPLADWLGRVFPRLPRAVAEAAALTGSAQLVCAPVITIFAGQISLVALPANLLAAPAIPVTTVAGLAALALGAAPPALAALAGAAVWAGNAAAAWVAWVAQWVATWPLAAVPWPSGAAGFASAGAATVVLVVALRLLARAPGWARRAVAAGLIVALAVAGPLRRPVNNALGRGPPGDWALAVCDVGQGTAVALRSGEDSAIMVDVGPEGGGVGDCLAELGVERLDAVIVTHFHADHVGGLAEALDGRALGELVRGPACGEAAAAEQAVRLAQEAGAATREVGQIGALGGAAGTAAASPARGSAGQVQFAIYPPALAALCPSQASGSQESAANNASLAVFAQADGLDVWVLGDLEREGQEALLADLRSAGGAAGAGGTASSTQIPGLGGVVVVAHHGSANQSEALARALAPRVAVMSAGRDNPYGHPTDKAIALYGQSAEIRRTDQEGLIALTGAGGSAGANLVG